jgi:hypothetical protein
MTAAGKSRHSVDYALAFGATAASRGNSFSALPPRMARLSLPFSVALFNFRAAGNRKVPIEVWVVRAEDNLAYPDH